MIEPLAHHADLLKPSSLKLVIPCYNCEEYIGECLASIEQQSFTHWTALVADDGSTDGTADKVEPFLRDSRFTLRQGGDRQYLMGNTLAALRSLELKPSDVVAIVDGDDLLLDGALQALWDRHQAGYDIVYTDEDIQGQDHSIGRDPVEGVPIRHQLWCFSQLRSFKAYLFSLLSDDTFRDPVSSNYFRAAGDLSLYLPMAELAGPEKICFVPEKHYYYRVHEQCNFRVMRAEQLDNNRFIRSMSMLPRQTEYFDHVLEVDTLDKGGLFALAEEVRNRFAKPQSVCIRHRIPAESEDAWRAYHDLWIERGVYLTKILY
ncbi:MAG: glycosyltransferase family 2 protein [Desulfovibrio sp.]|nr:MAG: glycosyltransferase family 2 protein [Desulfovibrio sp.]